MKGVETVELRRFRCLRCGHRWITRLSARKKPKLCPKCHNPNWNVDRGAGANNNVKGRKERGSKEERKQAKSPRIFYDDKKLKEGMGN